MNKTKPIFVIDTNVLIDYEDIIPSPDGEIRMLEEPTVDLSKAHLVIPTVVIRELSKFKSEKSERGKTSRVMLKRLRELFAEDVEDMQEIYRLNAPIEIGEMLLSILPVHKNFRKGIPFSPSDVDMDGQIILTTLAVEYLLAGLPIDGTVEEEFPQFTGGEVTLLTNDNGLAIRARERGLKTMRYGHKYPEPYTGRRDIVVPKELFLEFYNGRRLEREIFEMMMPGQPKLVANEFIVMSLENETDYPRDYHPSCDPYFERIGRYDLYEDAIVPLKHVGHFPVGVRNPGQAIYAEALMSPEFAAVICTGPAGTGKTYMATIYGYTACQEGQFIGVTVVPCESKSKLGALPGDLSEKMDPEVQPLKNALRNYLLHEDSALKKELANIQKFGMTPPRGENKSGSGEMPEKRSLKAKLKDRVDLIWDNWFSSVPIENARGRDFAYELAIYDEFQDQNAVQADTLVKRLGDDGKIILTGDIRQIHSVYLDQTNNGLVYASRMLFDNPMVAQVCFTEDEVVRHPLVQLIAKRQDRKSVV